MMHCLLFNVNSQDNHAFVGARQLGIYRIAHFLREHGWEVEVVDWASWWTEQQLTQYANSRITKNTKFLGFSHLFSVWHDHLERFVTKIKVQRPDIKVISGSAVAPHFDSVAIDYYIKGFGENAVLEILKWLFSNGTRPRFDLLGPGKKKIIDANAQYPSYPMQSLMVRYQDRDFIQSDEWLTVEFARGCKFNCDFCNFPVLGVKGDYSRDADDFDLQMRDAYDRFGVTNYLVSDETFNDRPEKISKFARVVEKLPFRPWFSGYIRADLLTVRPQDREELLAMNFLGHFYGIETFNPESAKSVSKGFDSDRLKQGLLDVRKYFETHGSGLYRGTISLIVGLPFETEQSMLSTEKWLIDHWQGQSFVIFIMEISASEVDKESKISKHYEKYGYKIFVIEDASGLGAMPGFDYASEFGVTNSKGNPFFIIPQKVLWKNEFMDIFKAAKIVEKFVKIKKDHDFRLDCYSLQSWSLPNDMPERLSPKYNYRNCVTEVTGQKIQRYIDFKLNWTGVEK